MKEKLLEIVASLDHVTLHKDYDGFVLFEVEDIQLPTLPSPRQELKLVFSTPQETVLCVYIDSSSSQPKPPYVREVAKIKPLDRKLKKWQPVFQEGEELELLSTLVNQLLDDKLDISIVGTWLEDFRVENFQATETSGGKKKVLHVLGPSGAKYECEWLRNGTESQTTLSVAR